MNYLDLLDGNIDGYGFITQNRNENFDGGDSLHREAYFMYAMCLSNQIQNYSDRFNKNLNQLECSSGKYKRHPDTTKWYSQCDRMSRDQLTPLVIVLGEMKDYKTLNKIFLSHLKRGLLFTTNTIDNYIMPGDADYKRKLPDITGPSFWSYYIRSYGYKLLYPALYLFDVELLINSIVKVVKTKTSPKDCDDNNHIISILQSKRSMSTCISKLAAKIYQYRNAQKQLDIYYRPEANGPALNIVYKSVLENYNV